MYGEIRIATEDSTTRGCANPVPVAIPRCLRPPSLQSRSTLFAGPARRPRSRAPMGPAALGCCSPRRSSQTRSIRGGRVRRSRRYAPSTRCPRRLLVRTATKGRECPPDQQVVGNVRESDQAHEPPIVSARLYRDCPKVRSFRELAHKKMLPVATRHLLVSRARAGAFSMQCGRRREVSDSSGSGQMPPSRAALAVGRGRGRRLPATPVLPSHGIVVRTDSRR